MTPFDKDFFGNKIDVGDRVIFEAPKYRSFAVGTVVTKAEKTCQIQYVNNWNYSEGKTMMVRQAYDQIIKCADTDAVHKAECRRCAEKSRKYIVDLQEELANARAETELLKETAASKILEEIETDLKGAVRIIKESELGEVVKKTKLECYETDMQGYIADLKKEHLEGKNNAECSM